MCSLPVSLAQFVSWLPVLTTNLKKRQVQVNTSFCMFSSTKLLRAWRNAVSSPFLVGEVLVFWSDFARRKNAPAHRQNSQEQCVGQLRVWCPRGRASPSCAPPSAPGRMGQGHPGRDVIYEYFFNHIVLLPQQGHFAQRVKRFVHMIFFSETQRGQWLVTFVVSSEVKQHKDDWSGEMETSARRSEHSWEFRFDRLWALNKIGQSESNCDNKKVLKL